MSKVLRTPPLEAFDPDAAGEQDAGIYGLPFGPEVCSILLLSYPWEPTTSYSQGTAWGPEAIRQASAQLDLFDLELSRLGLGCPYTYGIYQFPEDPDVRAQSDRASQWARQHDHGIDLIAKVNAASAVFNQKVEQEVSEKLDQNRLVGVLGGDHSVPFGAICAHAKRERAFGILHVDAHADLRVAYEGFEHSHASIMHNVLEHCPSLTRLVQVGIRDLSEAEMQRIESDPRITPFFGPDLVARQDWNEVCSEILGDLPERIYISIDIDGLDPSYCPNTGTPVPGGLSFSQLQQILLAVANSGKTVIGFDLVEVAPPIDAQGQIKNGTSTEEWDANVGARILYRLCGTTLFTHGARNR